MKIVMYGDSVTDAGRNEQGLSRFGHGYVRFIAGELLFKDPKKYQLVNKGISGNKIVDLYARVKKDVWNQEPDVLSILVGVNDVWHEIDWENGVDLVRWERVYRMLIEETKECFPDIKIILCEPFILPGSATNENYERFLEVKNYAKKAKQLAEEYGLSFVSLQDKLDKKAQEIGAENCLVDGVHPEVAGAKLIADEWLKVFYGLEK